MDFNPLDLILHLDVYLDLLVTNTVRGSTPFCFW
jgi:hypothetical protein